MHFYKNLQEFSFDFLELQSMRELFKIIQMIIETQLFKQLELSLGVAQPFCGIVINCCHSTNLLTAYTNKTVYAFVNENLFPIETEIVFQRAEGGFLTVSQDFLLLHQNGPMIIKTHPLPKTCL